MDSSSSAATHEAVTLPLPGNPRIKLRTLLLALGALSLLTGFYGALWRIGWVVPGGASLAVVHGPLMISGLFGTVISLERAVALGQGWSYAAPTLAGLGSLLLISGLPENWAAACYTLAAVVLALASLRITMQEPTLFTGTLLFAAIAWLTGNILWLMGQSLPDLVTWWLSFLILTIAGERLELSRLMDHRRGSEAMFLFSVGLLFTGARNGLTTENGAMLFGIALIIMTVWLLRHDIARLNIRRTGQTRFMAACMLAGYGWLGVGGISLISLPSGSGFSYDIALHATLIGFVLSMVFGHALIILPAVARIRVRYSTRLYWPLLTLHASVAVRIGADLAGWQNGRQGSAILTLLALLGLAGTLLSTTRAHLRGTSSG